MRKMRLRMCADRCERCTILKSTFSDFPNFRCWDVLCPVRTTAVSKEDFYRIAYEFGKFGALIAGSTSISETIGDGNRRTPGGHARV